MANIVWGTLSAAGVRVNDYTIIITETESGHRITVERLNYPTQYIDIPDTAMSEATERAEAAAIAAEAVTTHLTFDQTNELTGSVMEQGNINSAGNSTDSTTRIRSKTNAIQANANDVVSIKCGKNQRYYFWRYYGDGTRESEGWITEDKDYIMTADCQIRILVSHVNEAQNPLTPSDNLCELYVNGGLNYTAIHARAAYDMAKDAEFANDAVEAAHLPGEIISIAHRGYKTEAPENTIPAFALARNKGFKYVETDLQLTSDNVLVLSHDATIDRCSNGEGTIRQMTFAQLRQFDYGSWFSPDFIGTAIPSFEEFMMWCRDTETRPYLEIKTDAFSNEIAEMAVAIARKYRMLSKCTWISSITSRLKRVSDIFPSSRLGYVADRTVTAANITDALTLKNTSNEVFIDANFNGLDAASIQRVKDANLSLELYSVTAENAPTIDDYVSGATADSFDYAKYKRGNAGITLKDIAELSILPHFLITYNNATETMSITAK